MACRQDNARLEKKKTQITKKCQKKEYHGAKSRHQTGKVSNNKGNAPAQEVGKKGILYSGAEQYVTIRGGIR